MRKQKVATSGLLLITCLVAGCGALPGKQRQIVENDDYAYALLGSGSPAVIFESGLGSDMDSWLPVFEASAAFTTVFAYDRHGTGDTHPRDSHDTGWLSDVIDAVIPGAGTAFSLAETAGKQEPAPRDGLQIVEELRRLLASVNLDPPYVLVAHSLGGMYAELYARSYPNEIAGLVLIDPRRYDFTRRCHEVTGDKNCDPPAWMLALLPDTVAAEYEGASLTSEQTRKAGSMPNVPIYVLTAVNGVPNFSDPMRKLWIENHAELVAEVPGAVHVLVKDVDHFIHKDQPQRVTEIIHRAVDRSRQNSAKQPDSHD